MELIDGIKTRRSIRKYKSQEVPKELIQQILDDAFWAPSAMNTQTWKILVFSGEKQKAFNTVIEDAVLEYLGMQDDWKLVGITPLGYADQNPPIPPRKGNPVEWFE